MPAVLAEVDVPMEPASAGLGADGQRVSFAAGVDRDAALAQAVAILRRDGVVVLDGLADPALLARCRAEIEADYPHFATPDRALNYGPYAGRHCMGLVVDKLLADRAVFLPDAYRRIAAAMLGPAWMVDSVGLLVAMAGAPEQKPHADATLFPEARLDAMLPAFALACAMPLVAMDAVSGRTAFWRGSHRRPAATGGPDYAPVVQPGAAIVWDFRIRHRGLANTGAVPRPVIFTVLSREWWVEMHPPEATRYRPLQVARPVLDGLTPKTRHRLHRAVVVG